MMALVDDESLAEPRRCRSRRRRSGTRPRSRRPGGAGKDAGDVAPALAGHQAEIEAADPGGRGMQDVEAVPAVLDQPKLLGEAGAQGRSTAAPSGRASAPMPRISIGCLACRSVSAKPMLATRQGRQRLGAGAELLDRVGQRVDGADPADLEAALRASACAGAH